MKNTIKKYGKYAAIVGGVLFAGSHFLIKDIDFGLLEILGYISIFASLLFVFFGIKHYRDQENNGVITFGKAMLIGLCICAISGLVIGILDIIYVTVINPDFIQQYIDYTLEGMKSELNIKDYEEQRLTLTEQMKMFDNPILSGILMFGIVFSIGTIITIISSLILKRK